MGDLKRVLSGEEFLVFDGAFGTMLQQRGLLVAGELPELLCLSNPQAVVDIHRAYVEAGSQVATTNTFGANAVKLDGAAEVGEVFAAAVKCARDSGARYVAADVGPTGELMSPMGDLTFSEAYDLFAEQGRAAQAAGADFVIVETMADLLEAATAVIALQDSCSLPVFASMTFTASGRTFLGTAPREAALALNMLGVDALGVNCSAGPADLQPVVAEMLEVASCPVIVQANAGLPEVVDGKTTYAMTPDEYAAAVLPMIEAGAGIVGGCCGTTPDCIREVVLLLEGRTPVARMLDPDRVMQLAREAVEGGGRDAELLEMVLDAADRDALKHALVEEFDD